MNASKHASCTFNSNSINKNCLLGEPCPLLISSKSQANSLKQTNKHTEQVNSMLLRNKNQQSKGT